MPRLSLWKPTKTNDYYFLDRSIREQFRIGGTGAYVHKYLGPSAGHDDDPSQPNYAAGEEADPITGQQTNPSGVVNETKIQDLLFMENRDRKYDKNIYDLRGVYNVGDNDFDLSQFGLFLTNDMLFMTFHMNEMVETMGRKLMSGDVIELPHLLEELALDATKGPIPKFYVVQDANRGGEGFSATWMPHIWRVKLSPLTDTQEYSDILGTADDDDSLKNLMSTYKAEIDISKAIKESGRKADPDTTADTSHLFGIKNENNEFDMGEPIPEGEQFPSDPNEGDFFVRTDFNPTVLFVRRGNIWHNLGETNNNETWEQITYNAGAFVENKSTTVVDDDEFDERQALSKVILPKPDFGNDE